MIGPHYNLPFDAAGGRRSGRACVGRNFRGDGSATRRANNTHVVSACHDRAGCGVRRALMMQNRYRGHHYRGLNDVGHRASRCTARGSVLSRESRRQPINVTTARRLTLAACNLYVHTFVYVHVRGFASNPRYFDRHRVETICILRRYSSCCHPVPAYVLWLSSLRVHHLDRRDIPPSIKSMSHAREFFARRQSSASLANTFLHFVICQNKDASVISHP